MKRLHGASNTEDRRQREELKAFAGGVAHDLRNPGGSSTPEPKPSKTTSPPPPATPSSRWMRAIVS